MLINIINITLTINLFVTLILIQLELRYYDRLCSARSLNVYWIIVLKFKILLLEILLSINISL